MNLAAGQFGVNVSQEQMMKVGNQMGKAMTGNAGSLSKAGIVVTKVQKKLLQTGTEAQRVNTMISVINQNYGGMFASKTLTPEGRVKRLSNAWRIAGSHHHSG